MRNNYKLTVRYDGTRYFGWEHQPTTDMTIQGKLETVLRRMLNLDAEDTPVVIGAGRTDAGVHARAMTCNVLLDTALTETQLKAEMNRYLPEDISVDELHICADRFHSRYKAKGKTYCYTCWQGDGKPVFDRRYVTVLEEPVDVEAMRQGMALLVGMHDFKGFCGNNRMKKSSVRVIFDGEIKQNGPYIRFFFHGNGFLQNQVRIMTGTLLEIGAGKRRPEDIAGILERGIRAEAGPTAPAKGLCLLQVEY